MARKLAQVEIPPRLKPTIAELVAETKWLLNFHIKSAAKEIQEFANKLALTNEDDELYAEFTVTHRLKWAEGVSKCAFQAQTARRVLHAVKSLRERQPEVTEGRALVDALNATIEELTRKLMRDYLRGNSTSAFSNAVEATERSAAADFVEKFEGQLHRLRTAAQAEIAQSDCE